MPGQAGWRGAAADQFIRHGWMEVMHGVGLHRRGVFPAESERAETAFHRSNGEPNFFSQAFRAKVAVTHDTLGIASAPLTRFGAAGDDECRRRACPLARAGEGECIK